MKKHRASTNSEINKYIKEQTFDGINFKLREPTTNELKKMDTIRSEYDPMEYEGEDEEEDDDDDDDEHGEDNQEPSQLHTQAVTDEKKVVLKMVTTMNNGALLVIKKCIILNNNKSCLCNNTMFLLFLGSICFNISQFFKLMSSRISP